MKKIFLFVLLISSACFSQFKYNYKEIQERYPADKTDFRSGFHVNTKAFKNSVEIDYFFSVKDSVLTTIVLDKLRGWLSQKEIEDFQKEYITAFKPTRTRESEEVSIAYDEEKQLMMVKRYSSPDRKKLISTLFTINKDMIKELIALMNLGY